MFTEIRRLERLLITEHDSLSKHAEALEESQVRIGEIKERIGILRGDVHPSQQTYWPPSDLGDVEAPKGER